MPVVFKNLQPNAVGIRGLPLPEVLRLARQAGFDGVDVPMVEAAEIALARGVDGLRRLFDEAGVRPGSWGLPVAWQRDEAQWRADLERLPKLAELAAALGCTRCATWVPPGSNERAREENVRFHAERFRPAAEVLAAHGCRLGLEFIGPKTLRDELRHPFVYRMEEMLELGARIGPNVGLLLDAYHVYTSGGSNDDVARLRPEQVVVVHVNDAVAGVPRDEQQDRVRRLPLASGVIDLAGFMRALVAIGYDGPVTVEPFDEQLNALAAENPQAAADTVAESLGGLWQLLPG